MTTPAVATARDFVAKLQLPSTRRSIGKKDLPPFDYEAAKAQAMMVGSDVVSFVKEVTPEQRSDIVNALLLAQLVAKTKTPAPEDLEQVAAWYRDYFEVLSNIGFLIQEKDFRAYTENADGFEAHQAILQVAATLLGGAPTALAVLTSTLNALKEAGDNQPWITLFDQESRSATTARFQVSTAGTDDTGVFVCLSSFGLRATSNLTQVLFFKFHSNEVKVQYNASKVSINAQVLQAVRQQIADKLIGHTSAYVAALPAIG